MKIDVGRIIAYVVAGVIAAAIIWFSLDKLGLLLGGQDAAITLDSKNRVALHKTLVEQRARIRQLETDQESGALAMIAYRSQLRRLADSLQKIGAPPAQVITILQQADEIGAEAYRQCTTALVSCRLRASLAEAEADTLAKQLALQVTVRDKRCGLFVGLGASAGFGGTATGGTVLLGCRLFPK